MSAYTDRVSTLTLVGCNQLSNSVSKLPHCIHSSSAVSNDLAVRRSRLLFAEFSVAVPLLWNKFPTDIRHSATLCTYVL